jgi:ribosome biogenesis protein UTP30
VRALHLKAPESVALPLYSAPGSDDAKDTKREGAATVEQGRIKRRKK